MGFRGRLFVVLALFAVLPPLVLSVVYGVAIVRTLPMLTAAEAWERVAETGLQTVEIARREPLSAADSAAVEAHSRELNGSLQQSMRFRYLASQAWPVVLAITLLALGVLGVITSRVAGHLSRQLSRPLQEIIGWTERIARGEELPEGSRGRGAPEFDLLRARMRRLAQELARGRARDVEAARLRAFRESASQVAHELKNPLTPIRFAVERLKRDASPHLAEAVNVIAVESQRLEEMARSFSQFGRLPEGPVTEIDVGEMVRYAAQAAVPERVSLELDIADDLPSVHGHHDALSRALANVLLNAVEACRDGGTIGVRVRSARLDAVDAIEIAVRDTGCGIPSDQLEGIWEPYVTHRPGGTGLGLAIARQTIIAHQGEVRAQSTVGEGTVITFIIPADRGGVAPEIGVPA